MAWFLPRRERLFRPKNDICHRLGQKRVHRRDSFPLNLARALVQRVHRRDSFPLNLARALVQRVHRRDSFPLNLARALVQRGQRRERM